ncbi:hypothetical protein C8R44DRAFT_865394 [Mycena epipterygia]|nr:hypothetical protein C8R44DRAFT_865394 [Mycena epipterygia]
MAPHTSVTKLPTQRTVPMQVLALGFPRTGTASLKIALETPHFELQTNFC